MLTTVLPPPLGEYAVESQAGHLLRRAHQRHTALFQDAMAGFELTPTQFTALVKIVELGRVTQNHLGRLAAMDPATIQGVVRRLVARGLASTAADPLDRRTVVLTATSEGCALAATAVPVAKKITVATLAPLNEREQRLFLTLIIKLA